MMPEERDNPYLEEAMDIIELVEKQMDIARKLIKMHISERREDGGEEKVSNP